MTNLDGVGKEVKISYSSLGQVTEEAEGWETKAQELVNIRTGSAPAPGNQLVLGNCLYLYNSNFRCYEPEMNHLWPTSQLKKWNGCSILDYESLFQMCRVVFNSEKQVFKSVWPQMKQTLGSLCLILGGTAAIYLVQVFVCTRLQSQGRQLQFINQKREITNHLFLPIGGRYL